jgi:hypothetical protein
MPSSVGQETTVQAKSRSMLVAALVTSAIALLDAGTGGRAILLGLLIVGPLLNASREWLRGLVEKGHGQVS